MIRKIHDKSSNLTEIEKKIENMQYGLKNKHNQKKVREKEYKKRKQERKRLEKGIHCTTRESNPDLQFGKLEFYR